MACHMSDPHFFMTDKKIILPDLLLWFKIISHIVYLFDPAVILTLLMWWSWRSIVLIIACNILPWEFIIIVIFTWIGKNREAITFKILECVTKHATGFSEFFLFSYDSAIIDPGPFISSTRMAYLWSCCYLIPLALDTWNPSPSILFYGFHYYSNSSWNMSCWLIDITQFSPVV